MNCSKRKDLAALQGRRHHKRNNLRLQLVDRPHRTEADGKIGKHGKANKWRENQGHRLRGINGVDRRNRSKMRFVENRKVDVESQRFQTFEFVFWCKRVVVAAAAVAIAIKMEGDEEKKRNGKGKRGSQLDKQTDRHKKEGKVEMDILSVIQLMKEKMILCGDGIPDMISRSPMRSQDCHHSATKPYDYPCNVSRVCGGVTRVVEAERSNSALYRRMYSTLQTTGVAPDGHVGDVDLCDISMWLNLCKRDPKFLNDFVEDCQNELSKRDMSSFYSYRTVRNGCSNVSSQFASPAQSPSEQSVTSPESSTCDENSLYQSKSPNIPPLDDMNLKPVDKEEKVQSPAATKINDYVSHYPPSVSHLNIPPDGGLGVSEPGGSRTTESFPNIGTVMLNLAEDPYESTIDLNHFSTVCDTQGEVSAVSATTSEPSPVTSSVKTPVTTTAPSATADAMPMTEREALSRRLDPKAKETAWSRISQLDIDLLGKGDKEGDTQLMILLVSEKLTLEYVYVIVERLLKQNPAYLSCRNDLNQDALYLAAFKLIGEPLVASYIAEALIRGKQDKYEGGNTILHCLAQKGDTHVKVLERLLELKNPNGSYVFDVNKKNNKGFTPLHVACEVHRRDVHAYQTVRVLIENGAKCTAKDYKDENTPLHTLINESCDVDLLRVLLESERKLRRDDGLPPAVVPNRQGNTALHLCCARNALAVHRQKDAIRLLLRHGAMIQLKNMNGCVPSVLLDAARKQEIKAIFHGHRTKAST